MRPPGGHTLLEVIISFALFMLVVSTAFNTLVPGLTSFKSAVGQANLQESVLLATRQLTRDLQFTDMASVVILGGENHTDVTTTAPAGAVAFVSGLAQRQLTFDSSGFPLWNQFEVWYLGADPQSGTGQSLWLQTLPITPTSAVTRLRAFTPHPEQDTAVVRNVSRFEISAPFLQSLNPNPDTSLRTVPVTIRLDGNFGGHIIHLETATVARENSDIDPAPPNAVGTPTSGTSPPVTTP